ncbi:hypothetical protein [Streptomyces boncukensis]|uniref:Major tail protein n=1 Tax=Streptomyces boncukensis TaxID=2711219 RepID=A0A6G4X236_9ACTN|nr:hypothetical protein [Streptomyces boncukensis]NGO71448.1 hypothetical protein [Streptomyces boncukensis]
MEGTAVPLDDNAVLNPAVGHYYFAPTTGQPLPDDITAPAEPWADFGHTSLDDPFGITTDGGETETLGTWQNKNLRNTTSPRVESVTFALQQWDESAYRAFWGANATTAEAAGRTVVQVPSVPQELEGALFVLVRDGANGMFFHFPRVSIARADDIEFDAEELAGLPVRATVLGMSGQEWTYQVGTLAALSTPPGS